MNKPIEFTDEEIAAERKRRDENEAIRNSKNDRLTGDEDTGVKCIICNSSVVPLWSSHFICDYCLHKD